MHVSSSGKDHQFRPKGLPAYAWRIFLPWQHRSRCQKEDLVAMRGGDACQTLLRPAPRVPSICGREARSVLSQRLQEQGGAPAEPSQPPPSDAGGFFH